jgi:hypothetical protein
MRPSCKKSKRFFAACHGICAKNRGIAPHLFFKSSTEMLCRFESTSQSNILNWQVGKLEKLLGYGKSVMPNVFDRRHIQFGFE